MTWPMARLMALETRNNSRKKGSNGTAPALPTSRVSPHALAAAPIAAAFAITPWQSS